MTTSRIVLAAAGVALTAVVLAQTPQPQPEIFLASLSPDGSRLAVGAPVNISQNADYDNQPAFLPDGRLVMAQGTKLLTWRAGDQTWTEGADLSAAGLTQITRLAVSPDGRWMALVAMERARGPQ